MIFCICSYITVVNDSKYYQDNEDDFWHETIRLSDLMPNSAQKCVILEWPSALNFTGKPSVTNYTIIRFGKFANFPL